jgi:hypothetical protein
MMHAKIRKFWEEIGDVLVMNISDSELFYVAPSTSGQIVSSNGYFIVIADKPSNTEIVKYYFRGNSFDETEMLRIIKLKAFL